MGAVLQLERFDRLLVPPPPPGPSPAELEAAYAAGLAAGHEAATAGALDRLTAAVSALEAQLAAARQQDAQAGTGLVAALRPLIESLLDGVMPQIARARLQAAMLGELMQLAEAAAPLRAAIRCGADMAPFVEMCVARTALEVVELDPTGPEGTVQADLLGGTILWDLEAATRQLRELVTETMEGY